MRKTSQPFVDLILIAAFSLAAPGQHGSSNEACPAEKFPLSRRSDPKRGHPSAFVVIR